MGVDIINHVNNTAQINMTLENFKFAFSNKFIWELFVRSISFSVIATLICLLIAYPLALLIAKSARKYRDLLILLIMFSCRFSVRSFWIVKMCVGHSRK